MMTREQHRQRSPESSRRRRKERRDSREQLQTSYYQEPIEPMESFTNTRSRAPSTSSTSSSTSSSLLNISRPSRKFGLRTFFSGSDRKHRRRVKKKRSRFLRFGNSSSSSVGSDLAYGKGYIDRRRSREFTAPNKLRPRRSGSDLGRPAPPKRAQTDEEIIELGRKFAEIARQRNVEHLKAAGRTRPSTVVGAAAAINQFHRTNSGHQDRRIGSSKTHRDSSSDDSDWESASEDESSSEGGSDTGLAYGSSHHLPAVYTGYSTHIKNSTHPTQLLPRDVQLQRKPSLVDPKLFGPMNSLRGYVQTPCGFEKVDRNTPSESRRQYEQSIAPSESIISDSRPLQQVFPVPTSDPSRFDAGRGSIVSIQQDLATRPRPAPVPLQQPRPIAPVSSKVFDSVDIDPPKYSHRSSSGSVLVKAAAAGLAGAAVGAALSSDTRDRRDDRDNYEERRDRDSKRRLKYPDTRVLEDRTEKRKRRDDTRDDRHEKRREKEGGIGRDYDREKYRQEKMDSRVEREAEREKRHRDKHRDDLDNDRRRERAKEEPRNDRKESRKEEQREEKRASRSSDIDKYKVLEGIASITGKTPVDPFQYQVADDFATPKFTTPKRPLTPNVVTVDREPDFSRFDHVTDEIMHPPERLSRKDSYERELRDAHRIYEAAEHATAPVNESAFAAAAASVLAEDRRGRSRSRGGDFSSRHRPDQDDTQSRVRDPVQEEANRIYRENNLARKLQDDERRSHSSSPDQSVVDKYKGEEEAMIIEIITPPEMDHPKTKSLYDGPDADVRIDHILEHPNELSRFKILGSRALSSRVPIFSARDPSAERDRPMLNLVRPTPVSTPTPEKQFSKEVPASKPKKDIEIDVAKSESDVVVDSRGEAASTSSTPTSKVVSWGENQTKHYVVESPEHEYDSYSGAKIITPAETPRSRPGKKKSGWGVIAAAVAGAGASTAASSISDSAVDTEQSRRRLDSVEQEKPSKRRSSLQYENDLYDSPNITAPKPSAPESVQMPGAFTEDPSFTANIAAGLEGSGFDPSIVIDDPNFHRRESPPGSNEPFSESGADRGVGGLPNSLPSRTQTTGFVIGELPNTPAEEKAVSLEDPENLPSLTKKEKRRLEKAAKRDNIGKSATVVKGEPSSEPSRSIPEDDWDVSSSKLSKKEQKKRVKAARWQDEAIPDDLANTKPEPEVVPEVEDSFVETPIDDAWDDTSSKKRKSKKSKKAIVIQEEPLEIEKVERMDSPKIPVAVDASQDFDHAKGSREVSDWDPPKKSKKKSNRGSGAFDTALAMDEPYESAERIGRDFDQQAFDAEKNLIREERPKRDSSPHGSSSRSVPLSGLSRESSYKIVDPETVPTPNDDWDMPTKSKKKSKRDSSAKSSPSWSAPASEVALDISTEDIEKNLASLPEDDWDLPKESRKKSKRESGAYDSASTATPTSETAVEISNEAIDKDLTAIPEDTWDHPKKSKKKRIAPAESSLPSYPSILEAPEQLTRRHTSEEVTPADDLDKTGDWDLPKKSKKKKKKAIADVDSWDLPQQPEPAIEDIVESPKDIQEPVSDLRDEKPAVIEEEWDLPKKSKKKSKRDSSLYEDKSEPFGDLRDEQPAVVEEEWDLPKKSKKKSKRDSRSVSQSAAPSEVSVGSSSRISKRDSYVESPSRSVAASEVGAEDYRSGKKSKTEKRRSAPPGGFPDDDEFRDEGEPPDRGRDPFQFLDNDVSSVVSDPTRYDGHRSSRSRGKGDDLEDDAKSVASAPTERDRKHRKSSKSDKDKRNSGSSSLFDRFKSSIGMAEEKERSRKPEEDKKSSFLDNAGILGAGAGLAGAAIAIASQETRSNATDPLEKEVPINPSTPERRFSPPPFLDIDPEIVEREIRPAIDPRYGDLLPLPPSTPGSPLPELGDDLPPLPESRPGTPEDERERLLLSDKPTHVRRRSDTPLRLKTPSQSAIPISFRLGQRSVPPSPGIARSSPLASSATTAPEAGTASKSRPRPTSWESPRAFKPLLLVQRASRESVVSPQTPISSGEYFHDSPQLSGQNLDTRDPDRVFDPSLSEDTATPLRTSTPPIQKDLEELNVSGNISDTTAASLDGKFSGSIEERGLKGAEQPTLPSLADNIALSQGEICSVDDLTLQERTHMSQPSPQPLQLPRFADAEEGLEKTEINPPTSGDPSLDLLNPSPSPDRTFDDKDFPASSTSTKVTEKSTDPFEGLEHISMDQSKEKLLPEDAPAAGTDGVVAALMLEDQWPGEEIHSREVTEPLFEDKSTGALNLGMGDDSPNIADAFEAPGSTSKVTASDDLTFVPTKKSKKSKKGKGKSSATGVFNDVPEIAESPSQSAPQSEEFVERAFEIENVDAPNFAPVKFSKKDKKKKKRGSMQEPDLEENKPSEQPILESPLLETHNDEFFDAPTEQATESQEREEPTAEPSIPERSGSGSSKKIKRKSKQSLSWEPGPDPEPGIEPIATASQAGNSYEKQINSMEGVVPSDPSHTSTEVGESTITDDTATPEYSSSTSRKDKKTKGGKLSSWDNEITESSVPPLETTETIEPFGMEGETNLAQDPSINVDTPSLEQGQMSAELESFGLGPSIVGEPPVTSKKLKKKKGKKTLSWEPEPDVVSSQVTQQDLSDLSVNQEQPILPVQEGAVEADSHNVWDITNPLSRNGQSVGMINSAILDTQSSQTINSLSLDAPPSVKQAEFAEFAENGMLPTEKDVGAARDPEPIFDSSAEPREQLQLEEPSYQAQAPLLHLEPAFADTSTQSPIDLSIPEVVDVEGPSLQPNASSGEQQSSQDRAVADPPEDPLAKSTLVEHIQDNTVQEAGNGEHPISSRDVHHDLSLPVEEPLVDDAQANTLFEEDFGSKKMAKKDKKKRQRVFGDATLVKDQGSSITIDKTDTSPDKSDGDIQPVDGPSTSGGRELPIREPSEQSNDDLWPEASKLDKKAKKGKKNRQNSKALSLDDTGDTPETESRSPIDIQIPAATTQSPSGEVQPESPAEDLWMGTSSFGKKSEKKGKKNRQSFDAFTLEGEVESVKAEVEQGAVISNTDIGQEQGTITEPTLSVSTDPVARELLDEQLSSEAALMPSKKPSKKDKKKRGSLHFEPVSSEPTLEVITTSSNQGGDTTVETQEPSISEGFISSVTEDDNSQIDQPEELADDFWSTSKKSKKGRKRQVQSIDNDNNVASVQDPDIQTRVELGESSERPQPQEEVPDSSIESTSGKMLKKDKKKRRSVQFADPLEMAMEAPVSLPEDASSAGISQELELEQPEKLFTTQGSQPDDPPFISQHIVPNTQDSDKSFLIVQTDITQPIDSEIVTISEGLVGSPLKDLDTLDIQDRLAENESILANPTVSADIEPSQRARDHDLIDQLEPWTEHITNSLVGTSEEPNLGTQDLSESLFEDTSMIQPSTDDQLGASASTISVSEQLTQPIDFDVPTSQLSEEAALKSKDTPVMVEEEEFPTFAKKSKKDKKKCKNKIQDDFDITSVTSTSLDNVQVNDPTLEQAETPSSLTQSQESSRREEEDPLAAVNSEPLGTEEDSVREDDFPGFTTKGKKGKKKGKNIFFTHPDVVSGTSTPLDNVQVSEPIQEHVEHTSSTLQNQENVQGDALSPLSTSGTEPLAVEEKSVIEDEFPDFTTKKSKKDKKSRKAKGQASDDLASAIPMPTNDVDVNLSLSQQLDVDPSGSLSHDKIDQALGNKSLVVDPKEITVVKEDNSFAKFSTRKSKKDKTKIKRGSRVLDLKPPIIPSEPLGDDQPGSSIQRPTEGEVLGQSTSVPIDIQENEMYQSPELEGSIVQSGLSADGESHMETLPSEILEPSIVERESRIEATSNFPSIVQEENQSQPNVASTSGHLDIDDRQGEDDKQRSDPMLENSAVEQEHGREPSSMEQLPSELIVTHKSKKDKKKKRQGSQVLPDDPPPTMSQNISDPWLDTQKESVQLETATDNGLAAAEEVESRSVPITGDCIQPTESTLETSTSAQPTLAAISHNPVGSESRSLGGNLPEQAEPLQDAPSLLIPQLDRIEDDLSTQQNQELCALESGEVPQVSRELETKEVALLENLKKEDAADFAPTKKSKEDKKKKRASLWEDDFTQDQLGQSDDVLTPRNTDLPNPIESFKEENTVEATDWAPTKKSKKDKKKKRPGLVNDDIPPGEPGITSLETIEVIKDTETAPIEISQATSSKEEEFVDIVTSKKIKKDQKKKQGLSREDAIPLDKPSEAPAESSNNPKIETFEEAEISMPDSSKDDISTDFASVKTSKKDQEEKGSSLREDESPDDDSNPVPSDMTILPKVIGSMDTDAPITESLNDSDITDSDLFKKSKTDKKQKRGSWLGDESSTQQAEALPGLAENSGQIASEPGEIDNSASLETPIDDNFMISPSGRNEKDKKKRASIVEPELETDASNIPLPDDPSSKELRSINNSSSDLPTPTGNRDLSLAEEGLSVQQDLPETTLDVDESSFSRSPDTMVLAGEGLSTEQPIKSISEQVLTDKGLDSGDGLFKSESTGQVISPTDEPTTATNLDPETSNLSFEDRLENIPQSTLPNEEVSAALDESASLDQKDDLAILDELSFVSDKKSKKDKKKKKRASQTSLEPEVVESASFPEIVDSRGQLSESEIPIDLGISRDDNVQSTTTEEGAPVTELVHDAFPDASSGGKKSKKKKKRGSQPEWESEAAEPTSFPDSFSQVELSQEQATQQQRSPIERGLSQDIGIQSVSMEENVAIPEAADKVPFETATGSKKSKKNKKRASQVMWGPEPEIIPSTSEYQKIPTSAESAQKLEEPIEVKPALDESQSMFDELQTPLEETQPILEKFQLPVGDVHSAFNDTQPGLDVTESITQDSQLPLGETLPIPDVLENPVEGFPEFTNAKKSKKKMRASKIDREAEPLIATTSEPQVRPSLLEEPFVLEARHHMDDQQVIRDLEDPKEGEDAEEVYPEFVSSKKSKKGKKKTKKTSTMATIEPEFIRDETVQSLKAVGDSTLTDANQVRDTFVEPSLEVREPRNPALEPQSTDANPALANPSPNLEPLPEPVSLSSTQLDASAQPQETELYPAVELAQDQDPSIHTTIENTTIDETLHPVQGLGGSTQPEITIETPLDNVANDTYQASQEQIDDLPEFSTKKSKKEKKKSKNPQASNASIEEAGNSSSTKKQSWDWSNLDDLEQGGPTTEPTVPDTPTEIISTDLAQSIDAPRMMSTEEQRSLTVEHQARTLKPQGPKFEMVLKPEPEPAPFTVTRKKSKKDKKKKAAFEPESEPASGTATPTPIVEDTTLDDDFSEAVPVDSATQDSETIGSIAGEWPDFSTKRSKKDKKRRKVSGISTPLQTESSSSQEASRIPRVQGNDPQPMRHDEAMPSIPDLRSVPEIVMPTDPIPPLRTPSPTAPDSVHVDLSPAQLSSHIEHDRPFDQSTQPGKKVRTELEEDNAMLPEPLSAIAGFTAFDHKSEPSHTELDTRPTLGPSLVSENADTSFPPITPRQEIAASYFERRTPSESTIELQAEPMENFQTVTRLLPSTPSCDFAASYLEAPHGHHDVRSGREDIPREFEQSSNQQDHPAESSSTTRELAASPLESRPSKPGKKKKSKGEELSTVEIAGAVGAATGGVALLAEKFGGSREDKGKKHKYIDKRTTDTEDIFDDPALWESSERKPLDEGGRLGADAGYFWTGPSNGLEEQAALSSIESTDKPPSHDQSASREVSTEAIDAESPVFGKDGGIHSSTAPYYFDQDMPRAEGPAGVEMIAKLDELDTSEHFDERRMDTDELTRDQYAEDIPRELSQPVIAGSQPHDYVGFSRSPSRGLPPVEEETREDLELEQGLRSRDAAWKSTTKRETNRDSGFVMDSPNPQRHSIPESTGQRDSGVHMRDWPENTLKQKERVSDVEERGARLSWPKVEEDHSQSSTPRADEKRSKKSPLGNETPKLGTPTLHRTPESHESEEMREKAGADPKKRRSAKFPADLGIAAVSGAVLSTPQRQEQRSASDNTPSRGGTPRLEGQSLSLSQPRRSASNTSMSRLRTPEPLKFRPDSPGSHSIHSLRSSGTNTPPLRRVDKRMSGDLRSLGQQSDLSRLSNSSNPNLPAADSIKQDSDGRALETPNPVANEGRVRAKDMTDVYDGFGEGRIGSPRSPTRPHSMRRRQSMQVLELENRVEQLIAENRALAEARHLSEQNLNQRTTSAITDRDAEIESLKASLEWLRKEVTRLTEVNEGLNSANNLLALQHNEKYGRLENQHASAARELEEHRGARGQYTKTLQDKDAEIEQLRAQLEETKEQIREMQRQILATKPPDDEFLRLKDEDHFDRRCQQLCSHVHQWVLRFSKFSDMRACRLASEIDDDKIVDRLENAILDGSDVDDYLSDRVRRRDIFMSMTMNMIWEFVFTRYLFGMDREQRQKLKSLEKLLTEVGPPRAVRQWRAVTLTLLSKRPAFGDQRNQDTEAVVQAIFQTLCMILPPPSNLESQIQSQLRRVMREAVDLSIEMRTQRAEFMMLPPLQPEYDTHGDLAQTVNFNAALMNERSGDTFSNEELEAQEAVVRCVLFPLVVKKGDDDGVGDDEIVVCPAQVLVAKAPRHSTIRGLTPSSEAGGVPLSRGATPSVQEHSTVSLAMTDAPPASQF